MREAAAPDEERPLGGYLAFMGAYTTALTAAMVGLSRTPSGLPQPSAADILLLGIATHKTSRLLTREKIARPLRAPFTELEGKGDLPRELDETPRKEGTPVRRALGELLVCPYCLSQWIATTLTVGLSVAPRQTRFAAGILAAVTVADFLQPAYRAVEKLAD